MTKQTFFLSLFLIFSLAAQATTITWTNTSGDDLWSNPANWDLAIIPDANYDVNIPEGMGSSTCDLNSLTVQSITIRSDSRVTIIQSSHLTIQTTNSTSLYGLNISEQAQFKNKGIVEINFSPLAGIFNSGRLINVGLIDFDALPEYGLQNFGTVQNRSTGRLEFDEVESWGIYNTLYFYNDGSIRFLSEGTGDGLLTTNSLNNREHATIFFEGQHPGMIVPTGIGGSISNSGLIDFSSGTTGNYCISSNFGRLLNTGELRLNGGLLGAIHLRSATFTNRGTCVINGTNPDSGIGIRCSGDGAIALRSSSLLEIHDVDKGIYLEENTTQMNNEASCLFSQTTSGLYCFGQVLNQGTGKMNFEDTEVGIYMGASGNIANEGTINFKNSSRADIRNDGEFINQGCATINGDGSIGNVAGTFINHGWLLYPNDGPMHQIAVAKIINKGIIVDPYYRFEGVLVNYKVRVLPFVNPSPGILLNDVWDIANADNLVNTDVRTLPGGGLTVGDLSLSSNGFLANSNIFFASEKVYTKIYDEVNRCSKFIEIRLEYTNSSLTNNEENTLSFRRHQANEESTEFKVYPNPSGGIVNLMIPTKLSGPIDLRLFDHTGKLLWQEARNAKDGSALDFTQEAPTGIYLLQLLQNGQLMNQQKIVLQKN